MERKRKRSVLLFWVCVGFASFFASLFFLFSFSSIQDQFRLTIRGS